MKIKLLFLFLFFGIGSYAQKDKGRTLFFGVNIGTKIANKNYAQRYSGIYSFQGTNQTQLEASVYNLNNYNIIREKVGNIDFIVPFDAYSQNMRYTPGLLTGLTIGYQISPNFQVSGDVNLNKLKIKDVFTIQVLDGSIQTTDPQIRLGNISAEESRFDGRFNFDYIADGGKARFIIGASALYSIWRMDSHIAIFEGHQMPLYSRNSALPENEFNVVRGAGVGVGVNLGVAYRVNDKIMSQIMYQPYQTFIDYGIPINRRILLQHDLTIRFLWK